MNTLRPCLSYCCLKITSQLEINSSPLQFTKDPTGEETFRLHWFFPTSVCVRTITVPEQACWQHGTWALHLKHKAEGAQRRMANCCTCHPLLQEPVGTQSKRARGVVLSHTSHFSAGHRFEECRSEKDCTDDPGLPSSWVQVEKWRLTACHRAPGVVYTEKKLGL